MATNTGLTAQLAVSLLKGREVSCPKCKEGRLLPRHSHKNQNTAFKCSICGEIYRPCKKI